MRPLIIHGHFYQPPRENPWTGLWPMDAVTHPDRDWNTRIHRECYRPNSAARITDEQGRIRRTINNFELLNFNVGPTLMQWLRVAAPQTMERIVAADRASVLARDGHGNAMAQAYNHVILPLASERDRRTQVRWGLHAFRHSFGREPEGMWLPECAVSHDVLDELIAHGLRYVVLAPQQAARTREPGGEWNEVDHVDPGRAYRYGDDPAHSIAVFFYDGALASEVSFGEALVSSEALVAAIQAAAQRTDGSVHLAVDGETFGHHKRGGERTVAHALTAGCPDGYRLMNYGQVLAESPPTVQVELDHGPEGEGSAWSCAHGVGRWIRDCGCRIDPHADSQQEWRGPLRRAFDALRDAAAELLPAQLDGVVDDPWLARDDYVEVLLDRGPRARESFLTAHLTGSPQPHRVQRVMAHMELQHQLQLMYSSCGWFFDDLAGVESVQTMRHAARALDLWGETGVTAPLDAVLDHLAAARSNLEPDRTGADLFRELAMGARVSSRQMAAVVGLRELQGSSTAIGTLGNLRFEVTAATAATSAAARLAMGRVALEHTGSLHGFDAMVAVYTPAEDVDRVFVMPWPGDAEADAIWTRVLNATADPLASLAATFGPQIHHELGPLLEHLAKGLDLVDVQDAFLSRFGPDLDGVDPAMRRLGEALGLAV